MNKQERRIYNAYRNAGATSLRDVYGTWSKAKENAMDYCRRTQYEQNGYNGRIISANTFQFTYAFVYETEDDNTPWLYYITKSREITFPIEES